jgi:tyrosine-protein kinase Etk/Wzc
MAAEISLTAQKEYVGSVHEPPTAGHNPKDGREISLLDLLIVLAERKRTILKVTAAFTVLALVVSLVLPKRYTATVALLPPQHDSTMSAMFASQLGSVGNIAASLAGGSLGIKNPNDLYVGMLKSRTIEDAMIQNFGLMDEYHKHYLSDARKVFERRTEVDGDSKDGLIHISVEDSDPRRASELANGYVTQFRDLSQHLAITEAGQRVLFFEQQLQQTKDNLANAEEALVETEKKTGLIQVDSQARALIETAASVNAQIAVKEMQIRGMQTYATGENAQLVEAEQELGSLRAQLAKLGGTEDLSGGGILVPKGQVPAASLEYVRRLRDVKYYNSIFEILAQQFELAKLDQAKEGALIQIVDSAIPPDKRSFPKRGYIILGGFFAGLFMGICVAFASARLASLKSEEGISAKFAHLRNVLSWRVKPGTQQTDL